MKYIIVYGNPIDGFNFRGPFDSTVDAIFSAEDADPDENWWVAELNPVETQPAG